MRVAFRERRRKDISSLKHPFYDFAGDSVFVVRLLRLVFFTVVFLALVSPSIFAADAVVAFVRLLVDLGFVPVALVVALTVVFAVGFAVVFFAAGFVVVFFAVAFVAVDRDRVVVFFDADSVPFSGAFDAAGLDRLVMVFFAAVARVVLAFLAVVFAAVPRGLLAVFVVALDDAAVFVAASAVLLVSIGALTEVD